MQYNISPIVQQDRANILDVLRGIALLGICLANYPFFAMYVFQTPQTQAAMPTANIDTALKYFQAAFIDGKFYSLFSLLFGIGFTIILQKIKKSGKHHLTVFYRRIIILLLIGLAHALVLWEGDILLLYALLGLFLPLFRNMKDRTLLILSGVLIVSPLLFDLVRVISNGRWDLAIFFRQMAFSVSENSGITEKNYTNWLVQHKSFGDIMEWNKSGFFFRWEMLLGTNRLPKVFAMFLLGLYAGRKLMYIKLEENKLLFKKIQKRSLLIGLPATIVHAYLQYDPYRIPHAAGLLDTLFYALSVIPLSLFYTTSICLFFIKPSWQKRLLIFAPVGRMALTNYIMQTIFGIYIFYGVGLGWGATIGLVNVMSIALAVYILQLIFSNWWFKYFQFGPLEWVWRQLTYGKRLPIISRPGHTGVPV